MTIALVATPAAAEVQQIEVQLQDHCDAHAAVPCRVYELIPCLGSGEPEPEWCKWIWFIIHELLAIVDSILQTGCENDIACAERPVDVS